MYSYRVSSGRDPIVYHFVQDMNGSFQPKLGQYIDVPTVAMHELPLIDAT
jgi:hypothetical protein